MSDGRYVPQHAQVAHPSYADGYHGQAYPATASSASRSSRQPMPYANGHLARAEDQAYPGHHSSYSSAYPARSANSPLANTPQLAYANGTRPRSSSISAGHASSNQYSLPQHSPMPANGGHHRSSSQAHGSLVASSQRGLDYSSHVVYPHRPQTPSPSSSAGHYYGHPHQSMLDAQVPASPQRPFPCDLCALSFNRQHDLKRHKETHSGERPFLCNGGCGKTFTRKDALKRHQVSTPFSVARQG